MQQYLENIIEHHTIYRCLLFVVVREET